MGLIDRLFKKQEETKAANIRSISKILGQHMDFKHYNHENQMAAWDAMDKAEQDLYDLCESQPDTKTVLGEFQISRDDLKKLYHWIIEQGGGQWKSGHWVPASSLAYPETLRYIFTHKGQNDLRTVVGLLEYFESGEPLP